MNLHLGCGSKYIPGFVHVDLLDYPHVDFRVPVDRLTFAEDDSIELIYASHVLEHFGRHETDRVLAEWHRVLKRGGVLRCAVPDFEAITQRYLRTGNLNELVGLVCGGQKDQHDYHKMILDQNTLTGRLLGAGFSSVSRYDWRKTEHSSLDDYSQAYLPYMDKVNGQLMSLNLEATK